MKLDDDTIAAIATAPGRGGIGIVRLSGAKAFGIAATIGSVPEARLQPRLAQYATFRDGSGEAIDEGLVLPFRAPASFTGEDVVELHGHGGPVVMDLLLARCLQLGARLARPGEFSERAFLNDKLDLAQAEAIADLIDARTAAAARGAVRSLQGAFSERVGALVEALIHLRTFVEAAIDFPEEEIDFLADGQVCAMLRTLESDLDALLAGTRQAALLREGITVVIAGRPNAGKSSLLNALTGREAAIVTPVPGTTRDLLRESCAIDGIPLHLVDTAGLRDSVDPVEQEGIRRAWAEVRNADVVLLLVDGTEQPGVTDPHALWPAFTEALSPRQALLVVRNKCDLSGEKAGLIAGMPSPSPAAAVVLSARTGEGLDALRLAIRQVVGAGSGHETGFTARRRHLDALQRARAALVRGRDQLETQRAGELLAEDLRAAQEALGEITGTVTADELLGHIFSSFCIGK